MFPLKGTWTGISPLCSFPPCNCPPADPAPQEVLLQDTPNGSHRLALHWGKLQWKMSFLVTCCCHFIHFCPFLVVFECIILTWQWYLFPHSDLKPVLWRSSQDRVYLGAVWAPLSQMPRPLQKQPWVPRSIWTRLSGSWAENLWTPCPTWVLLWFCPPSVQLQDHGKRVHGWPMRC